MGQFTDYLFPSYGIRFIALTDNVDTANSQSAGMDMMPIMNIFNEWHCATTSKKIKTVFESSAMAGKYLCTNASYGYVKSDDGKNTPIIDPEAAEVVRRIFELRAKDIGAHKIAVMLNADGILSPSEYYYRRIGKPNVRSSSNLWCKSTVNQILKNPIYIGILAQMRNTTFSYKNHKRIPKSKEDWIVVENNHEPIITQELWDKVREYDQSVSRGKQDSSGYVDTFSGLLYCADCGYKMKRVWLRHKGIAVGIGYTCGYHSRFGKNYCTTHTIKKSDLEVLVTEDINSKLQFVIDEEKARKEFIAKKSGIHDSQAAVAEKRKHEIEKRLSELDALIQSAYENMVIGKVPEEVCVKLIEKYQTEDKQLQSELTATQEQLNAISQDEHDVDEFICRLKKYANFEVLTREMLLELVEYITIEDVPENSNDPRRIHVYYKFIDKALTNKNNALL